METEVVVTEQENTGALESITTLPTTLASQNLVSHIREIILQLDVKVHGELTKANEIIFKRYYLLTN